MSNRAAVRVAWLVGLLSVALISAAVVLLLLNRPARLAEDASTWGTANVSVILGAAALAFTLVGALVASRRPGNPIGWISGAVGFSLRSPVWQASTLCTRLCPSPDRCPARR